MELVYYSLAGFGNPNYERQWVQSIRSLRAYNGEIPVHLFLYNSASDSLIREAGRQRVTVHRLGDYRDALRNLIPEHAETLSRYPTFHKVLSLRCLPVAEAARVLYLDCDTFFFGDVTGLFQKYRECHFYAREEPWSRRSHYGYQPSYFDEDRLRRTTDAEGLAFIPPYNTGVCVLNHGVWRSLGAASQRFLGYAWRLLVGLCENPRLTEECDAGLLEAVRLDLTKSNGCSPLAYPSSNWWILEEIAVLLTLGGVPGLSHGALLKEDAVQNGEYSGPDAPPRALLVHYFSHLEGEFFQQTRRL